MSSPYNPDSGTPNRYAPTAWNANPYSDLQCPSGQLCLVRKLQPMDLVAGNLLSSSDLLAETVAAKIAEANAGPQDHKKPKDEQSKADAQKIVDAITNAVSQPEQLDSMVDTVVCKAVVEPRIEMVPKDFNDRVPGTIYCDAVTFADKMFIFNWAMGGLDNLKGFRGQARGDVPALESGEGV